MIVGLVSSKEAIVRRFELEIPEKVGYIPNFNIHSDQNCLFISSDKPGQFSSMPYGMVPYSSKGPHKHYHAPVENPKTEHKDGLLRRDIILDPVYRKAIRSQRGILPVDYFIVADKNNHPYLVFSPDKKKRPMALACVWDHWKKEITDDLTYGFAILTIPAFGTFKDAGIEYMPLILDEHQYRKWVKPNLLLTEITAMLIPVPKTGLNAFPVSHEILCCDDNDKRLIESQGELLIPDKHESKRAITDKFQRKVQDDPGFEWGYMKLR